MRRVAQLAPLLAGATFAPIRGNVDTRLRKLDAGEFDALVLACAGLRRLGFGHRISAAIPVDAVRSGPGQGIVAIEIRLDDEAARAALADLHDEPAGRALAAERALVAALGGGCQLPLGAFASEHDGTLELLAVVASLDGSAPCGVRCAVPPPIPAGSAGDSPAALGRRQVRRRASSTKIR